MTQWEQIVQVEAAKQYIRDQKKKARRKKKGTPAYVEEAEIKAGWSKEP